MNDSDSSAIIGRIKFLIKKMGVSQSAFAKKLGMDPANISKHLNGHISISQGLLNRISADLGVSKQWLINGVGLPFDKVAEPHVVEEMGQEIVANSQPRPELTPVYDIDVTAGAVSLERDLTSERVIGYVDLPDVRPGGMLVRVYGDSMSPTISDGAFVAIRRITDPDCIFWGQIYVVVLDDFRVVKFLRRHPDPDMVILRSDNPRYDDMEVRRDKIRGIYLVESILNMKIQC
ncbi:MAG: helix-turn-helix domain-containing protein [Bacteroides sp.]|nr:helix-turn-helix domain-containing protein [Bacteroides sp.]MCM1413554.1 helix-turn-helix domain-containing protein [Bacteroides sp.]MCM1471108.1 helix-turn-helix domain-containing protein [Bacteroides sp.]